MRAKLVVLAAALASAALGADLFRDDFSKFPPGWLTSPVGSLNAAIQEYHYLAHRGVPLGAWESPIAHLDSWIIGDERGKPYLEEQLDATAKQWSSPLFVTGDAEWGEYAVEVSLRPLSLNESAGVVFRYHTNRHYYLFSLSGGKTARLVRHDALEPSLRVHGWTELASVPFAYDVTRYYRLRVENEGPRMRAYVDGKLVLEASDSDLLKGKAGVFAATPARFQDFAVTAPDAVAAGIRGRVRARETELEKLRAQSPRPKLWKKFDTPVFGAGRNVRFGDLDGDGVPEMLIAQNIPRIRGDAFDQISCLTAVSLDGKVLWQQGRADARNGLLTNDTPFQIHDIDGDGKAEVVAARDFELQVLDGRTGEVRRRVTMPQAPIADKERPYELETGDSIAFVNFSGDAGRHEIVVKDRYAHFWVYNNRLELLWKGDGQTGHYPYPYRTPGGLDLLAMGYALWDHTGRQLWSHDKEIRDHADGVMVANLSPDAGAEARVYASGSDEGFLMFDLSGKLLKQVRVGHNQSPVAGKFRMDIPGLQYMSINFWKNPGIVSLFDWEGKLLAQEEPVHSGAPMLPVNWRGDGQEFVLLSGNPREGGMLDGHLRRAVMFPDDGHPDLAAAVLDLTGDARDEVVLWDERRVWIYTQDRPFEGKRIYAPVRNPEYNESNYRTAVSLPGWREVR